MFALDFMNTLIGHQDIIRNLPGTNTLLVGAIISCNTCFSLFANIFVTSSTCALYLSTWIYLSIPAVGSSELAYTDACIKKVLMHGRIVLSACYSCWMTELIGHAHPTPMSTSERLSRRLGLEIDEVTTGASLSTGTSSPTEEYSA